MNLQKQLIGHWTCDSGDESGGTLRDRSGWGKHGSLGGNATVGSSGMVGGAADFDGSGDYIDIGHHSIYEGRDAISVAAWAKVRSGTSGVIIGKEDGQSSSDTFGIRLADSDTVEVYLATDGHDWNEVLTGNRDLSVWTHYALTWSKSSATLKAFVNGEQVGSTATNAEISDTTKDAKLKLGIRDISNNSAPLDGLVDDARVYARELSADEVAALANMRSPRRNEHPLVKEQVGHWTMDDGDTSGSVLHDRSGHSRHGNLNGGVTTGASGQVGQAYSFDGTDDGVNITDTIELDYRDFAIAAWIKPNSNASSNIIWFGADDPNTSTRGGIHLRVYYSDWSVRFGFYGDDLDTGSNAVVADAWNHVVCQYDAGSDTATIHIDGEQVASGANGPFEGTSPDVHIGHYTGSQHWLGEIDGVRVFERTLSSDEIDRLANQRASQEVQL